MNSFTAQLKMPIGISDFETIRKRNAYYVDKSSLISELINSMSAVTLFTRPRRFGKTLTMSMLESFFNIEKNSKNLFDGLEISKNEALCAAWMNEYPVISLTFKEIEGLDFETAYEYLKEVLADLFSQYPFLIDEASTAENDKELFYNLQNCSATKAGVKKSLKLLVKLLFNYYGKPVILLLDEYDVPLAKAADNGYYKEMLDIMRGILQVLKDNNNLAFAVITGCLRISKESIFTGTNNFKINTITSKRFNEYFGFTEREVKELLQDINASSQYDKVKEWYDGYNFGGVEIYCPWDVINYADDFINEDKVEPSCYWNNTSGNTIIRSFIDRFSNEIRDDFEVLLKGGQIQKTIKEDLTYDLLHSSEENFWSVLYLTGYLTMVKESKFISKEITLKIPNKEIREIFNDTIKEWFTTTVGNMNRNKLFQAIWNADVATITEQMTKILVRTISYYDYREDFYHAFLVGIFTGAGYSVKSNRENGEGRSDVVIKDNNNMRVAIFEVKYSEKKADLEKDCDRALDQIRDRQYFVEFEDEYEEVFCYGISFWKKRCLVKR
ncbi:AAA family ATPase [Anaerobutyricum soehngenii]|uniref:AAA family ATPase n=2 Tax=Anaerobutyricum soehngenii TaxID=105843 RepID=A0ABS3ZMF1_9FIRM|nr:AAA family ATPase [Anaerobutyricum soehngenii]MBP0058505.1 AAA family ATPase [Anaerobutyricum soehngenii]